ncbi:MAG: hypothetical protein AAFN59_04475 [Pseudomonadota bacterium]
MTTQSKIATCCYCGTRAALVFSDKGRHELACSACGAPLHDLKMLKSAHPGQRELIKPRKGKSYGATERDKPSKKKKKKKKSGFAEWLMDDAWDFIEDIFD